MLFPGTTSTMKLCLFTIAVLLLTPSSNSQPHVIKKRFLWKSLAQLAQPFIRKPQPPSPPQAYPQPHYNNYPAPPVFQVSPTAPQPIRVPPTSGQLYLPLPGNNYQQNAPPVYVPPSSYGSQPGYPQMAPGQAQWKPMATQSEGGPLYYGGVGGPVGPPSFPFQTQGGVSDVSLTNGFPLSGNGFPLSGVDVATLVSEPFHGSSVFLASSDRVAPSGFVKVTLPATVLRSVLGLGLDAPTIYLASTSIAPSQDFALLEVSNDTIEALRAVSQQPNSSRAAELPSTVSEDLVMAIKSSAPRLAGNATTIELDDVLSEGGLSFADMTDTVDLNEPVKIAETDPTPVDQDFKELDLSSTSASSSSSSSTELPAVFLAQKGADVPADYIRVLLPDDILRELRKRVSLKTLNAQAVQRQSLSETYLAPSTSNAVRPPLGLVPVHLSREALQVLNDYANEAEKLENSNDSGPQLELPRSVLEHLSKDSSQRVRLINGERDTVVKTGSTDVFIAPSNQKPPDGYVSIPLTEGAMSELKKNFLGSSIRTQDVQKGIPVRAYIAPADKKLPPGHVAVPLPDSILDSVRPSGSSGRSISQERGSKGNEIIPKENAAFFAESDSAVYLAPARKMAPSSFRKLKLPETIMEDLRQAIPATKLAESGNLAKDLTAAYLASANEYIPPGFLSIAVPDTLVKMLDAFSETRDAKEPDDAEETGKSSDKSKGRAGSGSRTIGGEEGSNISRKIIDALLEATGRTVSQVFKNSRGESKNKGRSRGRGSSGGSGKTRKGNKNNSRDNARTTDGDADENEFDRDVEDNVDDYQPHYQMSPFFPASVSGYPYVDPYQYSGLWSYGDANQWSADGSPLSYGEYVGDDGMAENRDTLYYDENGGQVGGVQYEIGQPQYEVSSLKKRNGEIQKETSSSSKN